MFMYHDGYVVSGMIHTRVKRGNKFNTHTHTHTHTKGEFDRKDEIRRRDRRIYKENRITFPVLLPEKIIFRPLMVQN